MKSAAAAAASLLLTTAHALPELVLSKRDANLQTSHVARGLIKRAGGTVETNVYDVLTWSSGGAYYANVTVGTPPQDQVVILDTGSSDLYFDASNASACEATGPYSCRGGTFDSSKSTSFNIVDAYPAFNTSFGDGSSAVGPFAVDTIGLGDVLIENVQFGVAEDVNSTTGYAIGLMGVGYSENEATQVQYPNMPEVLRDAGVINSRLYSVYLNDEGATSGTILFGGIDTSRFTGTLATVDIMADTNTGQVDQFISEVTALSATLSGKTTNIITPSSGGYFSSSNALPVLLDTGSSAWSIPTNVYNDNVAPVFPYVDQQGLCSCAHQNDDTSLTVTFANRINITVPAREFIVPIYNSTTNAPYPYDNTGNACSFMLVPAQSDGSGFQTLGDAILRSMYVVFDLDNGQLSLAQAAVNSSSSPNIVTVSAGAGGVASAVSSAHGTVQTAQASQTNSIAAAVPESVSFSVSSAASTIGTATGTAAVPADAQITNGGEGGVGGSSGSGGSGSGSGGSSSSKAGAAMGPRVGGLMMMEWSGMWTAGVVGLGFVWGVGLMV